MRTVFDRFERLREGEAFDVFTLLEASPRFDSYPKTVTGFVNYFHTELYRQNIWFEGGRFRVQLAAHLQCTYSVEEFLTFLLRPLWHCQWDDEMVSIRNNTASQAAFELAECLVPSLLRIEDVPSDWRDIVEQEIEEGRLVLAKFKSLEELEHHVDRLLFSEKPDQPEEAEEPLSDEEREVLVRTLGLEGHSFATKTEALSIYEERRRS